jgi:hypothetical protein
VTDVLKVVSPVVESRRVQGLPGVVLDPTVIHRIALLLCEEMDRQKEEPNPERFPQPESVANGSRAGAHTTSTKGDQRGE